MKNVALITGASGGIGLELARIHASNGGDLILVARRGAELEQIRIDFQEQYKIEVITLILDLSMNDSIDQLMDELDKRGIEVDYLINNAGKGGYGLFAQACQEEMDKMIRLNILSLTLLTNKILPGMVQRQRGRILNVASSAGYMPGPLQSVYFATKAFVRSFTLALTEELKGSGVTATVLSPGPVETGFARNAGMEDALLFRFSASSDFVARKGYQAMMKGKREVIPGFLLSFMLRVMVPVIPVGWLMRIVRKAQHLKQD